ncbi:sla2 Src-like adaptor 2 [Loxospora ochrophaea]|nr:sla2 Src-like adaptor 2 [Loxospora ochrophaea]
MSYGLSQTTTRNVDMSRSESDLAINIRKATSIGQCPLTFLALRAALIDLVITEETAPKRKHVRACIVYTWDHKSSQSFWAGMKVWVYEKSTLSSGPGDITAQPILADEVQTFKALITIHKVLQEGHPIAVREAQANVGWLESLTRGTSGEGLRGYSPLLREYVHYLRAKLAFHQQHPEFNGLFEYEEYISLKSINDPNEGYETISDLMTLQDQIDSFQKLIFSHFRGGGNNECRISALTPLVQESYGIYKFITSMLRAMHTTTDDDEALEPLRGRYNNQHYRLLKFYYECSNLRYLTSLITVPKLPQEPPNLLNQDEDKPALPRRPTKELEKSREPTPPVKTIAPADPEPINDFWTENQRRQQEEYDAEQRRLQEQWNQQQYQQQQAQQNAQREFEEQQRLQAEQQRLAQDQLMREQYQQQTQGRMAELERENLNARAQYERDQLMLENYDRRMKDLESQFNQLNSNFNQQNASKDEQIRALQEQVNTWRTKYEALAKLYSQLRTEHLDLLQKFKSVQLKANSAQEAIDRREKLEREIKTKNLELADMIRERDRALHEKDRLSGGNREEMEKLKRELRFALDKADSAERAKGSELSSMLSKYNREMADLEEALRNKTRALDDVHSKYGERDGDLERSLREKEEELEIYKSGMDQTLLELNELKTNGGDTDKALDDQIDQVLLSNIQKINDIIDSVLQSGVQRVDDAMYELDSTMQAGNQNASAPYVLSQIEKASSSATDFATAFNNFIADGPNSTHSEIIRTVNVFAGSIADVLSNTKGLTRFATEEKKADQLVSAARQSAQSSVSFFRGLQSFRLEGIDAEQKTDVVINCNGDVQMNLQKLSKLADVFAPKSGKLSKTAGDLGDLVDQELTKAAKAIEAAAERLNKMMKKPRDGYSTYELKIHDSILEASIAVTNAIARLIKAATDSQQEIVREGRGSSSRTAFYKKNNRWTEGLISAAKAVASSTNTLIETADGVISGRNSPEQLIVASNDVAGSTAQLVAASRVKANFGSRTQDRLEEASKAVGKACRGLVRQVQDIIATRQREEGEEVDYGKLSGHEFKVREMEQKVEILQLENNLAAARQRLGEMRKISYQEED